MAALSSKLRIRIPIVREVLAEFLGTFMLLLIGCCSVAQTVLTQSTVGTYLSITLSWGIAVAIGIYIAGGISGGHLNPAVTLALAVVGKFPWKKVIPYSIAQYIGGFIGAACTYWLYLEGISEVGYGVSPNPNATAGIFATYPRDGISLGNCFVDQIIGTGVLMLGVLAITDPYNMAVPKFCIPLSVGTLVGAIGMTMGWNCGYAINPARDFSPRFFTLVAGWGTLPFSAHNYYFWIPIIGPYIGAILGGCIYQFLIGLHWPELDEEKTKDETQF